MRYRSSRYGSSNKRTTQKTKELDKIKKFINLSKKTKTLKTLGLIFLLLSIIGIIYYGHSGFYIMFYGIPIYNQEEINKLSIIKLSVFIALFIFSLILLFLTNKFYRKDIVNWLNNNKDDMNEWLNKNNKTIIEWLENKDVYNNNKNDKFAYQYKRAYQYLKSYYKTFLNKHYSI